MVQFTCVYPESDKAAEVTCEVNAVSEKEARFRAYQAVKYKLGTRYIKLLTQHNTAQSGVVGDGKDVREDETGLEDKEKTKSGYVHQLEIKDVELDRSLLKIYDVTMYIRMHNEIYQIKHRIGAQNEEKAKDLILYKAKRTLNLKTIWLYKKINIKEVTDYTIRDLLNLDFEFLKIREVRRAENI